MSVATEAIQYPFPIWRTFIIRSSAGLRGRRGVRVGSGRSDSKSQAERMSLFVFIRFLRGYATLS
jgi:hypothetical protein